MSNNITEIEEQFFEAFGIKAKSYLVCTSGWDCTDAQPCEQCSFSKLIENEYPQITDRRLLELICIINRICVSDYGKVDYYVSSNYKDLKQEIISLCNRLANKNAILEINGEEFKHQVQALFKED